MRTVVWEPDRFFQRTKAKKPAWKKKKSLMCLRTVASVSGRLLLPHLCAANFRFVLCSFALGFLLVFLCWLSFAHLIVLCVFFSNCIYVLAACLSRFCFWRLLNWRLYKLSSHPDHLFNQICSATNMTAVEVICHFFYTWSREGVLERTYTVLFKCIHLFITL